MIIYNGVNFQTGVQMGDNVAMFPSYAVTTNKFAFLQGDVLTLTVNTVNVLDGTTLYWNVEGLILPGYMNVQSGSFAIFNNTATINITFLNDLRSLSNPGMSNFFYISIRTSPTSQIVASTQKCIVSSAGIIATGGTERTVSGYKYHVFTTSGAFTPTYIPDGSTIEFFIAAGGGGAGGMGGGGGSGGVIYRTAMSVITSPYTVVLGAGGSVGLTSVPGGSGGYSSLKLNSDISTNIVLALGGGGGAGGGGASGTSGAGLDGGSGGGGGLSIAGLGLQPTSSSGGYGTNGGNGNTGVSGYRPCGGGGGAMSAGTDGGIWFPGNGGDGYTGEILNLASTGAIVNGVRYVAGGGGGYLSGYNTSGTSGAGASSYGGGGASPGGNSTSGNGGVAIIRYRV